MQEEKGGRRNGKKEYPRIPIYITDKKWKKRKSKGRKTEIRREEKNTCRYNYVTGRSASIAAKRFPDFGSFKRNEAQIQPSSGKQTAVGIMTQKTKPCLVKRRRSSQKRKRLIIKEVQAAVEFII